MKTLNKRHNQFSKGLKEGSTYKILKLNKNWMPLAVTEWKSVIPALFSGGAVPCRITEENGELSDFTMYKNIEEWKKLTPRSDENYINTPHGVFIIPKIVINVNCETIPFKKIMFPSKKNIWERDNYTCAYTGKRLSKHELSIDHVIPTSRGGPNTWENMVTCERLLNSVKSDRTPEEMEPPLVLRIKPTKPVNGIIFDKSYEEVWDKFIK
jgi:hypothetical protein